MRKVRHKKARARSAPGSGDTGTLNRQVLDALRQSFMQGEFYPGQKLTLRDLARTLGTSMTPVREAISRLSALGVVTVHPKRHIEVKPLSPESYIDLVEVRKLLEGHAAAQAARLATAEEIGQIALVNRRVLSLAKAGKLRNAMKENQKFHFAIYRAARSGTLLEAIETLWLRAGPSINMVLADAFSRDERSLLEGFAHHDDVLQAIRVRDAGRARETMTADIDVSAAFMLSGLRGKLSSGTDPVERAGIRTGAKKGRSRARRK
jgi:DNA-binding GntR family transcriptional regulator